MAIIAQFSGRFSATNHKSRRHSQWAATTWHNLGPNRDLLPSSLTAALISLHCTFPLRSFWKGLKRRLASQSCFPASWPVRRAWNRFFFSDAPVLCSPNAHVLFPLRKIYVFIQVVGDGAWSSVPSHWYLPLVPVSSLNLG